MIGTELEQYGKFVGRPGYGSVLIHYRCNVSKSCRARSLCRSEASGKALRPGIANLHGSGGRGERVHRSRREEPALDLRVSTLVVGSCGSPLRLRFFRFYGAAKYAIARVRARDNTRSATQQFAGKPRYLIGLTNFAVTRTL